VSLLNEKDDAEKGGRTGQKKGWRTVNYCIEAEAKLEKLYCSKTGAHQLTSIFVIFQNWLRKLQFWEQRFAAYPSNSE